MPDEMEALRRLAELLGIEPTYYTIEGQRREAKPEVLHAVLKALDAPLHRIEDAADALRQVQSRQSEIPPFPPLIKRGEGGFGEHRQAFRPKEGDRRWGVFLPLYALRSERNWGVGDFTDLAHLADWTSDMGGGIVGTLPLLAAFLDDLFAPCPYTPISRQFWNELFIDVEAVPELARSAAARAIVASDDFQASLRAQRESSLVDYRGVMKLKRQVLDPLAKSFFSQPGDRMDSFRSFETSKSELGAYARFRAATEKKGTPWRNWETEARNGSLTDSDFDPAAERYHRYVQWIAHEQLKTATDRARQKGVLLYLDFPLGVHPDGFDAWRHPELFVEGVSVGAPPDPFFAKGQRWGFSPLHPQRLLGEAGKVWTDSLHHHMSCAGILRIDHVMGLHRLFWIPDGFEGVDGVYVRYPKKELYNRLCHTSLNHHTLVVGEDLGTVPEELRPTLHERGILRLFILSFEQDLTAGRPLPNPPFDCIAGLNTHDIPPFAAIWGRRGDTMDALRRCLDHLASGPAFATLVNLEDLWLETEPQNRPGTSDGYPNWRRKARMTFEQFSTDERVRTALTRVNRLRRGLPAES